MDDQVTLPTPPTPPASAPPQAAVNSIVPSVQNVSTAQGASDALTRATIAIQEAVARTPQNPAARMQAIIEIKAAYIRDQFGVDITQ